MKMKLTIDEQHVSLLMNTGIPAEGLKEAFDAASAQLAEKQQRSPVVQYFDLYANTASAAVPGCRGANLILTKQ